MNMITLNFIADDGHGWLEVSLKDYPFAKKCATGYGYRKGNTIYLEEDAEAPAFLKVMNEAGYVVSMNEVLIDGQWAGRGYARNIGN